MNDPNHVAVVAAGALGVVVGASARLIPDPVDITFIPAMAALGYGTGIVVGIVAGWRAETAGRIGAAIGAGAGVIIYLAALIGG
jgi:hypothetical protein